MRPNTGGEHTVTAVLDAYPVTKDSGVPELGRVPQHWEVGRLRSMAGMRVSNVDKHTKDDELPIRLCNYVDVYRNDRIRSEMTFMSATASADEIEQFRLLPGDVLITKDSESWNDIGVPALVESADKDVISGYHLALLRPMHERIAGGFLFRALQSNVVAHQFHVAANGVTRYGLSFNAIKSVWLPLPPLSEQAAIVRFLDHAEQRIRRHIRAKQKIVGLLKEQRQAIICSAVTRGLDSRVHLKPSSMEWLGDFPEHWEVRRNGRLFGQRNETGRAELPILEVSLRTGVRVRDFESTSRKQVMADREKYKRAARGDIAYNMMRMWQGAVGIAPEDGLVSPAYVVARPLPGTEARYFVHLFRTQAYMGEVDKYSRGIVKDRNRLYWEDFKQMPSCYPPFPEQVAIADSIDTACEHIHAAIERILREIGLLREYRTRLIADVVTGKLDVREAAASLPDQGEEPEPLADEDPLADESEVDETAQEEAALEEVEA